MAHNNLEYIGEKVSGPPVTDREAEAWSARRQDNAGVVEPKHLLAAAAYVKVGGVWVPLTI